MIYVIIADLKNLFEYIINFFKTKLYLQFKKTHFYYQRNIFYFLCFFFVELKVIIINLFFIFKRNCIFIYRYITDNWVNLSEKLSVDLIIAVNN